MIDLDQLHADWNLAEAHSKATKPGKNTENTREALRCPCCFRTIDKTPIGVCQNSKQLQFLGFGFPLYFKFSKYVIIMVLLQVISYNAIALYWSYEENKSFCQDHIPKQLGKTTIDHCTGFFVSIARIQYEINPSEQIVRIASFIIQLLALIYIRDKIIKANNYYDQISTTMSDYSIIIKDIPSVPRIQAKIRRIFQTFFSVPIKIEEMVVIGHLTEFYIHTHQKKKLISRKKALLSKKQVNQDQVQSIDYQIQQNSKHTQEQIERQIQEAINDNLMCQKIIITLETDPIKEQVIRQFEAKKRDKDEMDKLRQILEDQDAGNIIIMEAPQPNQIIWEHININRRQRIVRQILGWLLALLLIAVITTVLYFLLQLKAKILQASIKADQNHQTSANKLKIQGLAIVYGFIFAIAVINKFIIAPILHYIADFQKHPTKDKEEFSFALKYTLCLFFTTALVTLIVEDATLHNIYQHDYGVVQEESIMFFVNALFIPILWLINPWYIHRVIRRRLNIGRQGLTQQEANEIMEDVPVSIGKWYGEIIQTIWFTYFYATLIPVGAMVTLVGLIFHYWVDKYNLLHKTSIYSSISGKMCLKALKMLEITLIMKPLGSLVFDFQIRNSYTKESIICAAIALVYVLLPMDKILSVIHGEQFILEANPYQYVKDKFINNYKTLHPIITHKKILLQSQLSNLNFFSFNKKLQKKLSKKASMTIQLAALSPSKTSKNISLKEVLI